MSEYHKEFRKKKRLIAYVDLSVKEEITSAVNKGFAPSISSVVSDILKNNYQEHLDNLERSNRNKAANRAANSTS